MEHKKGTEIDLNAVISWIFIDRIIKILISKRKIKKNTIVIQSIFISFRSYIPMANVA